MTGEIMWWLPLGICMCVCLLAVVSLHCQVPSPSPPLKCVCVFTGFTEPGAIYRVDMAAEQPAPELFRQTKLKVSHNPSDYETHQVSLPDTRFPCQLDSKHFVLQHNGVHPLQQPPMHSLVDWSLFGYHSRVLSYGACMRICNTSQLTHTAITVSRSGAASAFYVINAVETRGRGGLLKGWKQWWRQQ